MKTIDNYINEKLKIGRVSKQKYTCQPKDKKELRRILEHRLANDNDADLNDIDVSKITDMGVIYSRGLFEGLDPHNIDISRWNVSNVEDMRRMFYRCYHLDCDLSDWDVSNVKDMYAMFFSCIKFTGEGLEKWDVSNVEKMSFMFDWCDNFKNKPSWYEETK